MPNHAPEIEFSAAEVCQIVGITYRQLLAILPPGPAAKIALGSIPDKRPDLGACWVWTGAQGANGYGLLTLNQQPLRAHVLTYTTAVGPVPAGLELDHLCERKLCVRPTHLEAVTHAENSRRHHAGKPTCKHGHPWTPETTYRSPRHGRRDCRICMHDRYLRRKQAA